MLKNTDKKKYASYEVEDYLEDDYFRDWILQPDNGHEQFWKKLFAEYPVQEEKAAQAAKLLKEMKYFFKVDQFHEKEVDKIFLRNLKDKLEENSKVKNTTKVKRLFPFRTIAAAASITLFTVIAIWLFLRETTPAMQIVMTDYGEWKNYILPDQSIIKLNANSEIKFPTEWKTGEKREVWLKGEANFEVAKDPKGATFTVYTDDLAIKVLGTVFNVHDRGERTQVFLEEGKVSLDLDGEEKIMMPGEYVEYSKAQKAITTYRKKNKELTSSWKDGSLIMRQKTVQEIFDKVEEIYGVEINVENKSILQEVKMVAIPMKKLEEAIPILEILLGVKIQKKGNHLLIK